MAGFIEKVVDARSTNPNIKVVGRWVPPPATHPHLTLILRDEASKKILFTTNCFSFQQMLAKTLERGNANTKVY